MAVDLEKMSRAELVDLRSRIDSAIRVSEAREKKEALAAAKKAAADFGFSLDELTGGGAGGKKPVAAKYRNPNDASQTWSGRGRKPQWIHDALAAGANISDLEI